MASPPASTKTSLGQKLRARDRWPQLTGVTVRFRGKFAYVTGQLPGGQDLPLCRLRYAGYASLWGFAIYRASHDDYQDSILPSGQFAGTPEEALDCACGLYLADPSAWLPPGTDTPANLRARALVAVDGAGASGLLGDMACEHVPHHLVSEIGGGVEHQRAAPVDHGDPVLPAVLGGRS